MSKARVLAVDDQLYFRVFLEDLLSQEDFEVRTASGAEEALAMVEAEDFDIILTDLVMPGMGGTELVERLKERNPEQEIVVVSSVSDVRTAVDAMKVGATDYLLKPIDRTVLARTLDGILERRRMREEHHRLMAENLEFMGAFSLYERALGLFATLSTQALADRIAEGLCLETHAHGSVLWLVSPDDPSRLRLVGARGLVRIDVEPEELETRRMPPELSQLTDRGQASFRGAPEEGAALYVPLRKADRLLGVARLTDKLDGGDFSDADRAAAEKFADLAGQAVANALQVSALERRSLRDPVTKAYTRAYFDDVARNEIQKASRFGRTFALVRIEFESVGALRGRMPEAEFGRWLEGIGYQLGRSLRATDLLAAESDRQFCLLLPETHSLGAAVLKRRLTATLQRSDLFRDLDMADRPEILSAAVSFPSDGGNLEDLWRVVEERIEEDRQSEARSLDLQAKPFRGVVDALLSKARPGKEGQAETAEQMTRFLLEQVARRPHDQGLLFVAPGAGIPGELRDGLEGLRGLTPKTDVVVVADHKGDPIPGLPVTWVSPLRAGTQSPFLVYYGEGPSYACLREESGGGGAPSLVHTSDRVLVEQMAFQLGRDLGIPIGE